MKGLKEEERDKERKREGGNAAQRGKKDMEEKLWSKKGCLVFKGEIGI